MFEGPAMVVVCLMMPAIVAIGSFGAGLAFSAISEIRQQSKETPQNVGETRRWSTARSRRPARRISQPTPSRNVEKRQLRQYVT